MMRFQQWWKWSWTIEHHIPNRKLFSTFSYVNERTESCRKSPHTNQIKSTVGFPLCLNKSKEYKYLEHSKTQLLFKKMEE